MGVEVVPVTEPPPPDFRGKMARVDEVAPPAGVTGSGSSFVLDRNANASFQAVNRILKEGGSVGVAGKAVTVDGRAFTPGAFVATGVSRDRMQAIAGELGLDVRATPRVAETTASLKAGRVGLYQPWQANMDAGWTEWLLGEFEFPFTNIHNDAIRAGRLEDRFDVIVIAEMGTRTIMDGYSVGTLPGEFVGGIGDDGLEHLKAFVKAGGTLVVMGNASAFAIEKFGLPVKNAVEGLKNEEFFCGGSLLKTMRRAAEHPLTFGLADEPAAFFARNGAFETERGFEGSVLLEYPKKIDDFARAAGTRAPGQKIDEYKAQLKAALVDMRGKDYAATNFTVGDLRIQFRLAVLEREIGDAVGGRSSGGAGL